MRLIKQSHKIINITPDPYTKIELAARTCYDSHDKITDTSAPKLIKSLLKMNHLTPFEFADVHVVFITDRSTSHELVRHRIASFQQSSQRYIKYNNNNLEFILPPWLPESYLGEWTTIYPDMPEDNLTYLTSLKQSAVAYETLLTQGWPPERARKVLPNSTATTIHMKANFREWMHILNLRFHGQTGRPDPTMHTLMQPLHQELSTLYPEVFRNEEKQ